MRRRLRDREEAYSLAIVLQELIATHGERPITIFATDVHRGSLEQATLGNYSEDAISNGLYRATGALLFVPTRIMPACG